MKKDWFPFSYTAQKGSIDLGSKMASFSLPSLTISLSNYAQAEWP